MSAAAAPSATPGQKQHLQLNVISPSPSIGRLHFPDIPTSCTILQLKEKICEAAGTATLRSGQQRLIYRGHVLAQEQRTMVDVFGRETIENTNEPLTIHLVINPGPQSQPPVSSTTSSEHAQHPIAAPPSSTTQATGQPGPESIGGSNVPPVVPPQAQNPPMPNPPLQVPQGNPFPQLQQMQQTIAFVNQQLAAQMAALNLPMRHNLGPNQQQRQPPQMQHQHPPHQPHPHVHNHLPHVHPNPALGTQGTINVQGNPGPTEQQILHQNALEQGQLRVAADQPGMHLHTRRPNSAPPPGLSNTNTVIRETVGPNGERHQSIVSSGTIQVNNSVQAPSAGVRRREPLRNNGPRSVNLTGQLAPHDQAQDPRILAATPLSSMQVQAIQAHMSSMESAMNFGTIPPTSIQEQTRTLLQAVAPTIGQRQYQVLETRRQTLSARASAMQRGLDAHMQVTAAQVAAQRDAQLSESSAVYVVASPNGPQALLVSPSGFFTTTWPMVPAPAALVMGLPDPPILLTRPVPAANAQQAHNNATQPARPQPNVAQQANMAAVVNRPPGQQQGAQAPNAARDIIRILIPLGGHLWLLIRLFGFVYFFTHGASWHRTFLLSLVAFLLFVAQTGMFQPILQTIWGPIRRHAEAILPLAANEQPRGARQPAVANPNAMGGDGRNREPTPQQAADRLLREREAQDGNFLRLGLRRAERAVALFVASLVPGVGERHIAAREAAEAARQQEEREREERARREAEEAAEGQLPQAQDTDGSRPTGEQAIANDPHESPGERSSTQEPAAQPPLVEV